LFADNARRANADNVICDSFQHAMNSIEGSNDTYFVIVTRGHRYDIECLRMAVKKPHAYVGMMGSRRRVHLVKEQLKAEGISEEILDKVHTPIGLDIGAETPEEIAVSIIAEIIKEKNNDRRSIVYSKEIIPYITGADKSHGSAVLCTIVYKRGSAPRESGTKMVILEDGTTVGTIGGGCAESDVIQKGLYMLRAEQRETLTKSEASLAQQRRTELITVNMTTDEAEEAGMVCGGTIMVFMERI
jgi:xanthine dehydrogenase accessory factor